MGSNFLPRVATFGRIDFDRANREEHWHKHNTYVDRLREAGIPIKDFDLTWESLCQALGIDVPEGLPDAFPVKNTSNQEAAKVQAS